MSAGLGRRRSAAGQIVARGPTRDRLHRCCDVVGDRGLDSAFTRIVFHTDIEENVALGIDDLLHKMRAVVDTGSRQRRIGRRHVDYPRLVLSQDHTGCRRTAQPVLGEGVIDPGETLGDAGPVRRIGHVLRSVLEFQHESVVAGVQRLLERLGDVATPAARAVDIVDGQLLVNLQR